MSSYSSPRNTLLSAVLVVSLAALVSNGLALDQRQILERDVLAEPGVTSAQGHWLPEITVRATRLAA